MSHLVALVTGASSGMGEVTARLLRDKGFVVYAAARRVKQMKPLEDVGINVLPLDLLEEQSIQSCIDTILEREGRIDVLINNAGYGSYGAVEDVPISEARRQFEVNLFGLARLTQLVLPTMRAQKSGKIVNVSSVGGKIYTQFGAWYHATKHALEGWSDTLRIELKSFGIDVVIVEPGGIKTEWGDIAYQNLRQNSGEGAYAVEANKMADGLEQTYADPAMSDPSVIGDLIVKAVTVRKPKARYSGGYMAKPVLFFRWLLTDRAFDWLIVRLLPALSGSGKKTGKQADIKKMA